MSAFELTGTGATGATGAAGATGSAGPGFEEDSRSSNTILAGGDLGHVITCTAAFTQTLTAAATLGDGWWCVIKNALNDGSSVITVDPNSSETIDGQTTIAIWPGESRLVMCTGSAFVTIMLDAGMGLMASITSPVTLTATTEATATTVMTLPAALLDGSTTVEITFDTPQFQSPGGGASRFAAVTLYQDLNGGGAGSIASFWGVVVTNANATIQVPTYCSRVLTPSAGSYVWSVRGYGTVSGGVVQAGAGGSGNYMPAYARVRKLS